MKQTDIRLIYFSPDDYNEKEILICGWIRTIRSSKSIGFIELNDGSTVKNIQIVFDDNNINDFKQITKLNVSSSIKVIGKLVLTPDSKQPFEVHAKEIVILATSSPDYPLQKKRHTLEYLRTKTHLRARTNTFNAAFKIRSEAAFAIHKFFNDRRFLYIHTPIITANDCEGAGEMFRVTTLDPKNPPLDQNGEVDFSSDFFGKPTNLTVSGQLEAETMALAFSKVYTFGPTFRSENSNTLRHAAEFWMVEPEVAFYNLNDIMALAGDMLKFVINYILEHCTPEIEFFNKFYDNGLIDRLRYLVDANFEYMTYTQAISLIEKSEHKFEYEVKFGSNLQTEHERYLTEEVVKKPLFVTDYPKDIKPFYMRVNDDNKTVAAMDMLVPNIGEIMGGSQREERLDKLLERMKQLSLDTQDYSWYIDLRKYGGVKHSGFGLGFERLIMYLTGISNIRDVLPFPRTTGNADI